MASANGAACGGGPVADRLCTTLVYWSSVLVRDQLYWFSTSHSLSLSP